MSQREFAAALGISPSSLSSLYNGHTSPTNNHVQAIHRRFPEINTNWLLFGEGEMKSQPTDASASLTPEGKQLNDGDRSSGSAEVRDGSHPTYSPDGNIPPTPNPEIIAPKEVIVREVKYIDKPQRKITEIRVFYDDGTFDTFS